MNIIVTGGAGFIGSATVRHLMRATPHRVIVVDSLTYAGSLDALDEVRSHPRFAFERVDICDDDGVQRVFAQHRPDAVMHLAAESHVDRSIGGPMVFVKTNVLGTAVMLEASRRYWYGLEAGARKRFRFLHVSTDEVFGSLGHHDRFTEASRYDPSSPYAASKAGSDHVARSWYRTFGLPVIVSNTCNNFGPYQFPEKFIPTLIVKALRGEPLPIYGDGEHIRDWLYVDDHAEALVTVLTRGVPGETYNVGGNAERSNRAVAEAVCAHLDTMQPSSPYHPHRQLMAFVADRPGHDRRYAIDAGKIERDLAWRARQGFDVALERTVQWYCDNRAWWEGILTSTYRGERQGLIPTNA
jgi:dTDP-glucose 4,6-dehydratase